jgi:hypothetical protein
VPTYAWLLIWGIVIAVVAFLAIREIRSGRKQPPEFDRFKHEAVREAGTNLDARGPNGMGQSFWS